MKRVKGSHQLVEVPPNELAINIPAMADAEHQDEKNLAMYLIDNTVITNPYSKSIWFTLQLFRIRWKWIAGQCLNATAKTLLNIGRKREELASCGRFEDKAVAHTAFYSPSSRFSVSQGVPPRSFLAFCAALMSILSSTCSISFRSSMGTMAATGLLRRYRTVRSPANSDRLTISDSLVLAVLVVKRLLIISQFVPNRHFVQNVL
jgi:hypothetical protein